jgi:hypothetical protein
MTISWDTYDVSIAVIGRLVGGIPVVPEGTDRADAYESWARGQGVEEDPSFARSLPETLADDPDMPVTQEQVEGLETGFRRDQDGIYIEARQVKAMLREAAQRLGIIKKVRGSRQVLQHDLNVRAKDGSQKLRMVGVTEPSGKDHRPISVVTRQGPRTAIKRFDFVEQPRIDFVVRILAGGVGVTSSGAPLIDEPVLRDMLEFGGELGLGADRSQGEGVFHLVSLEKRESE